MIFNMVTGGGSGAYELPILNAAYPQDVSVVESASGSATFTVMIDTPGKPAEYEYQWYVDGAAYPGATDPNCIVGGLTAVGTHTVYCEVTNKAGTVQSRIATLSVQSSQPVYTYSGDHELIREDTYNWKIKFKTSGTLRFSHLGNCNGIDVFCVGGGGGGSAYQYANASGGGGGGGYTKTYKSVEVFANADYSVVIGGGGAPQLTTVGGDGGQSYFGVTVYAANGGYGAGRGTSGNKTNRYYGGDGGSGGAGVGINSSTGAPNPSAVGGWDGNNGNGSLGGTGQGTTTGEFGNSAATLYGGGGAACKVNTGDQNITGAYGGGGGIVASRGQNGGTNTGGGGAGSGVNVSAASSAGTGGSGIVVIRNHR